MTFIGMKIYQHGKESMNVLLYIADVVAFNGYMVVKDMASLKSRLRRGDIKLVPILESLRLPGPSLLL